MKDEELLAGLIDAARKQASQDARFGKELDELAATKPSEEQIQVLLKQYNEMPDGEAAVTLFTPLSGAARDRIVDRIQVELGAGRPQAQRKPAKVIHLASWLPISKKTFFLATGAAAAAVLAFVLLRPGEGVVSLPDYQMSLYGEIKTVRGLEPEPPEPETVPVFRAGSVLQIVLRPDHAVVGKVRLSAYIEKNGGLLPIELPTEWDPQGSVRIYGVVGKDIRLPLGEVKLWLVVSRPDKELSESQVMALQAAGSRLVMKVPVRIEPDSPL